MDRTHLHTVYVHINKRDTNNLSFVFMQLLCKINKQIASCAADLILCADNQAHIS